MATEPKKRTAPKERRSRAIKEDSSEKVLASQLLVGDRIHFPNSRGAQEIASIVDDEESGSRAVTSGDTTWTLQPDTEVRRETTG